MERWLLGIPCAPFEAQDILFWPTAIDLVAALKALWAAEGLPWGMAGEVRLLELGSFHRAGGACERAGLYLRLALACDGADRPHRPDLRARALRILDGFIRHFPNRGRVLFHASGVGECPHEPGADPDDHPAARLGERLEAGDHVSVLVETGEAEALLCEPGCGGCAHPA